MKISTLKVKSDKLVRTANLFTEQHIDYNREEKSFKILVDGKVVKEYKPYPTIKKYHDDDNDVRLVMGPFGSGKSSGAGCAEIIIRAMDMPADKFGSRRCKAVVVRNTYKQLRRTAAETLDDWTAKLGEVTSTKEPLYRRNRFNDGDGIVDLEIVFLALDRPQDVTDLKSFEATFAWLNELSEIVPGVFDMIQERVGRYPNEDDLNGAYYWAGVFADTNPPDVDHWIYREFEEGRTPFSIYHQPPGLLKDGDGNYIANPDAENIKYLRGGSDYYLKPVRNKKNEEYIKVFCLGQYGIVQYGKIVYEEYNDDLHSLENIDYVRNEPITLFFDFGLTPAILILQEIDGQIRAIKEFCLERGGIKQFYEDALKPYLQNECDGLMMLVAQGDISGDNASQVDMETAMGYLRKMGINIKPAITNVLQPRLEAVKAILTKITPIGQPRFQLSRTGCPILRKGFLGKYEKKRVAVIGRDEYRDIPDKTHPYSDIQDALQYGALYYNGKVNKAKSHKSLDVRSQLRGRFA